MLSRILLPQISIIMLLLLVPGSEPVIAIETTEVPTISVDRVNQLLGMPDTVIIDVRKPRSWWRTSKKIKSAVREDPSQVDQWARKYTRDRTLIFY